MDLQQTIDHLEREQKIIRDKLNYDRTPYGAYLGVGYFSMLEAYCYAYGRIEGLLKQAIIALRQSDPSFGLQVMSYDEIVDREA